MWNTDIRTIDATYFRRDFGRLKDDAQRASVKVTSHGRMGGAVLSAHDLDHLERLKHRERQIHVAGDIPDDVTAVHQSCIIARTPKLSIATRRDPAGNPLIA